VIWVLGALGLLLLADALRLRARLSALAVLAPSDEPIAAEHRFLVAPGVSLDEATRRAASDHARREGLEVLDLVPLDLRTRDALALAQVVDPRRYRQDRLAFGHTAGHALLVHAAVLERAGVDPPADPVSFARGAVRLKRFASTSSERAVAPGLRAVADNPDKRLAVLQALRGRLWPLVLAGTPLWLALLALGVVLEPLAGLVVLGLFHAQLLLAIMGTRLRPRDLPWAVLLRAPLELWDWGRTVVGRWRPGPDPYEARRPLYDALLAGGIGRFFEARREDCPLCGGRDLVRTLRTRDFQQRKPGRFTLDRCRDCGHIFQNPRLSVEGLEFYYRDFYDGLAGEDLEIGFSLTRNEYVARAKAVQGSVEPARWLDVGGGHGHFSAFARDVWPACRFDGLDLSESIEEAEQRGWVDRAYRGLFPEVAPTLAGAYDVVSMSHYLEHTREPKEEIRAAHQALRPGGVLLIEVPDPASRMRFLLGRWWVPWFQPQHQHFLSLENLERLLESEGFSPFARHRGEAHLPLELLGAASMLLAHLAPEPFPWHPPSRWRRARYAPVWILGAPLLLLGRLVDLALAPLLRRPGWSNAYRVLARKIG
jgi:SAM-dependent methyltransferase